MSDRALDKSIWAPRGKGHTYGSSRDGDWSCTSCGFSNFQRRSECMRCSSSRTGTPRSSSPAVSSVQQVIISPPASRSMTGSFLRMNNAISAPSTIASPQGLQSREEQGLADSLWAPRRRTGNPQVWIKKCAEHRDVAGEQIYPSNTIPSTPISLDLGLPYEVQHFILSMMQKTLEEGCFEIAYRWIPNIWSEKGWGVPEAVELSTWRDFLPDAIPASAIVPVRGYSLILGLRDAVKIRNAAVHRHLCDNLEIRQMARQAQDLMTMFGDMTRQEKFHRLGQELVDWDRICGQDQQGARFKLEQALREISERPMNDMDWTPNAVSLQEITSDAQVQPLAQDIQAFGEAMDLD